MILLRTFLFLRFGRFYPGLWNCLDAIFAAALEALVDVDEERFERRPLLDQTLLVRIADQRFEIFTVFIGQPVLPRIGTEHALLLLPGSAIPGERDDARIDHALHGNRLRFVEGAEQVDRQPGMLV